MFKLAFLSSVETFSTHRKAGNGVKRKTNFRYLDSNSDAVGIVKQEITRKLNLMLEDLNLPQMPLVPQYRQASCLEEQEYAEVGPISAVLTSPPYANCFDYSKIYMSELWLGDFFGSKQDQQLFREKSVRSHVHATWDDRHTDMGVSIVNNEIRDHLKLEKLWSPKIGNMLSGYFKDLGKYLSLVHPHLIPGAYVGFVVGNSFYGGIPIATDLLLTELGKKTGYIPHAVKVYRKIIPSSQQYRKQSHDRRFMRESLVILQKPK